MNEGDTDDDDPLDQNQEATKQATQGNVSEVDFKILYEESKRKSEVQLEAFQKKVIKLSTEYDMLKEEYEQTESSKSNTDKNSENEVNTTEKDELAEKRDIGNITRNLSKLNLTNSFCCTREGCTLATTNFMLACSRCKLLTHYGCTQLPPYQISLFMLKGYPIYKCSECVGEVDSDIVDNTSTYEGDIWKERCNELERELLNKTNIIETMKQGHTNSDACIEKWSVFSTISDTYEQITENNKRLEKELKLETEELHRVYDEKNKHKNENLRLKQNKTLEEH